MASPAELMQTLSEVTGLPLSPIVDLDRRLVKAGLRNKGGRGLNAARMTPLDAARLLTAVLASPLANRAAEAVSRYEATCVDEARSSKTAFAATELIDIPGLRPSHGFVEGLTALITSAASGSLASLIDQSDPLCVPRLEVVAFTRATHGRIRISGLPNGITASLEYGPKTPEGSAPQRTAEGDRGDLEQSRRVTERTIFALAAILSHQGEPK